MKSTYHLIYLFVSLSLILISCESQDFNDQSKKNENWVWFVPNGSNQGSWKRLDLSDDSDVFKDGKCSFFYSNGQKREEYTADNLGRYDTLFLYNLESSLTHFTYFGNDEINNFILNNGEFKAFDPSGNLALIGTVESNKLINYQFAGKYLEFYDLIYHQIKSWRKCEKYMKEITSLAVAANQQNLEIIPPQSLIELDSMRKENISSIQNDIGVLKNKSFSNDIINLKNEVLLLDELILYAYTNYFAEVITTLNGKYNNENKLICQKLMQEFLDKFVVLDKKIEETLVDKRRELQINDFYLECFGDLILNNK